MGVGEKYNPTQKKPHRLNGGALEGIYGMPCQASGAEAGTRTRKGFPTRPSNVRVYQFHHFGIGEII